MYNHHNRVEQSFLFDAIMLVQHEDVSQIYDSFVESPAALKKSSFRKILLHTNEVIYTDVEYRKSSN